MESFTNLPTPVKALMAFLTGTSILGALAMIDSKLALIGAAGMFVLALLVGLFVLVTKLLDRKKSAAMTGSLQNQSGAVPSSINDPLKRAKLQALRGSFESGLDKFKSAGKDVYKLPWFAIVGEPGSGKSEAIRRSNVGFPPGLQSELQGSGGTINMNWWFANQAVFLDTAGKLIFEEVRPGENSEWKEFLQLLKHSRPNCPINGLLLVIPIDSLIKDNADTVARKAGKLAQQLDTIQRSLDIRFPVFILITKSDLLNGFREFFDEMSDVHSQHQILGWSNPADRDEPFRPEQLQQHFEAVIDKLRKRRLGLLKDPVSRQPNIRRTDEVDALYSFPHSLSLIVPRLHRYLETIFSVGEWSSKPLFLRGIYFTSSMREGHALDQELAEAMGCALDTLPDGTAWERERAYFLRDLFLEKVFREKGLVTRASNTKRLIRQRQSLLFGIGTLAFVGFLAFSLYQHRSLQESVGIHDTMWRGAAKDWTTAKWNPVLRNDFSGGMDYRYLGDQPVDSFRDVREIQNTSLLEIHEELRRLAVSPIETGWVFKPLVGLSKIQEDRPKAQEIVLNASVISPVLLAARQKMLNAEDTPHTDPVKASEALLYEARALTSLLRLEADALQSPDSLESVPPYFNTLLQYALNKSVKDDERISRLLINTYEKQAWPPFWAVRGSASLASNAPIARGVERLRSLAGQTRVTHKRNLEIIVDLLGAFREFQRKEHDLNIKPTLASKSDPALKESMEALLTQLGEKKNILDAKLKEAAALGLIGEKPDSPNASLTASYSTVISNGKAEAGEAFALVQKACAGRLGDSQNKLFYEVDQALKAQRVELDALLEKALSSEDLEALKTFDTSYLADSGDHLKRNYELRWDLYQRCHEQLQLDRVFKDMIGSEWKEASNLKTRLYDITGLIKKNQDKFKEPFEACEYFISMALRGGNDLVIDAYIAEVRRKIGAALQFPLLWPPGGKVLSQKEIKDAGGLMADIRRDLGAEWVQSLEPAQRERLLRIPNQFAPVESFRNALAGADGNPGVVTVALLNYNEQPDKEALGKWRSVVVNGRVQPTSVASNTEIGRFPLDNDFSATFKEYSDGGGNSKTVSGGGNWSLFKLLKQGAKTRQLEGGRRIQLAMPVDGRSIWFEFTFDKPLPDLETWPTKEKIGL
ncbi:MAG: type VI secretion protein IcmF/TssM N-terminal domain-containing protein [Verrucomicrobiota bacterium]